MRISLLAACAFLILYPQQVEAASCKRMASWLVQHFQAHEQTQSKKIKGRSMRKILRILRRMDRRGCVVYVLEPRH